MGGRTIAELQDAMSAEEAASWEVWMRRNPRGLAWDNWVQATLHRAIVVAGRDGNSKGVAKLDKFLYQPPVPLMVTRLKSEAQAKRKRKPKPP